MDTNQKLTQFMDAVNRSTDAEIARAEQAAEQEAAACLRDAEAACKAESARAYAEAESRITANYQKQMAQVGYRGKIAFLSRRQTLLMQLFAELREKLTAFTASPDYASWMEQLLRTHKPEADAVILLRDADMDMQDTLKKAAGASVTFRADSSIQLGGLSVLSPDGRRCENHTLDEAFAAQLRDFYRNHKIDGGNE